MPSPSAIRWSTKSSPKTGPSGGASDRSAAWSNSPRSRRRRASMRAAGQWERLARVRFLTLPFWRKDSRRRRGGRGGGRDGGGGVFCLGGGGEGGRGGGGGGGWGGGGGGRQKCFFYPH